MLWTLGGRYGNHFTEVVRGDYEAILLVRTHESVPGRPTHLPEFAPRDGSQELLAFIVQALNAAELRGARDPAQPELELAVPDPTPRPWKRWVALDGSQNVAGPSNEFVCTTGHGPRARADADLIVGLALEVEP